MQVTYELNPNEVTPLLLESLRALFPNRRVRIVVEEVDSADETTYLLKSPANREALRAALDEVATGKTLRVASLEELAQTLESHG